MRGETPSSSSSGTPDALHRKFQTDFEEVNLVLEKIYVDALNECNYGFDRQWTRSTVYESVGSLAESSDDDLLYSSESESADRSGSLVGSLEQVSFSDHDEELDNESVKSRRSSSSSFTLRTWSSVNSNPIDLKRLTTCVPTQWEGA